MASQDEYLANLSERLGNLDLDMFRPNSQKTRHKALGDLDMNDRLQLLLDYVNKNRIDPSGMPRDMERASSLVDSQDPLQAVSQESGFVDDLIRQEVEDQLLKQIRQEAEASGEQVISPQDADRARISAMTTMPEDLAMDEVYRQLRQRGMIPRAPRSDLLGE